MIDLETQSATAFMFTLNMALPQVAVMHSSISLNIAPSIIDTRGERGQSLLRCSRKSNEYAVI